MSNYRISYAQNREDILLSGFFDGLKNGFYVDVGANYPDQLSVTKIFYDKGWHGINIEPNKYLFGLIEHARPRDINLNIGAADKSGELMLREYPEGDGLSTFSKTAQEDYAKSTSEYKDYTQTYKDYLVPVKTLKDIFDDQKPPEINFMNIDVEGFEYQVIEGNDWDKYRPQVICIEANHIAQDWRPLLKKADYELAFFDGLNNYYVAGEHPEILKQFSYVKTILLDKPVIAAHFQQVLDDAETQLRNLDNRLNNKLTRQMLVEEGLRTEIHNLYLQIAANTRLRALLKQLIVGLNNVILIHIEKLNKPKLKVTAPILLDDSPSQAELLRRTKRYDIDRYYDSRAAHPFTYKILKGTYTSIYVALKSIAQTVARTIRRQKNV